MTVKFKGSLVEYTNGSRVFVMSAEDAKREALIHNLSLAAYLYIRALDDHLEMLGSGAG